MPVAVVTGANSGLGFSLCQRLLNEHENLELYLLCRNEARAEGARHKLQMAHPTSRIQIVIGDVSRPESVLKAAETLKSVVSRIDFLYLNAGIMPRTRINWSALLYGLGHWKWLGHVLRTGDGLLTQEDSGRNDGLREIFATNVFGHFILFQELEPLLLASSGRLVWTSSRNAVIAAFNLNDIQHRNGRTAYSSSKYLIDLLSYHIHARKNVTSVVACPGLVLTKLAFGIMSQFVWYLIYPLVVMMRLFSDIFTICPAEGAEALLYLSLIEPGSVDPSSKYCTVRDVLGRTYVRQKKLDLDETMAAKAYAEMEKMAVSYLRENSKNYDQ